MVSNTSKVHANGDLLVEKRDTLLMVTLNRPDKLNAITPEMDNALVDVCQDLTRDSEISALVLIGSPGAKPSFSAGMELGQVSHSRSEKEILEMERRSEESLKVLESVDVPTIACVDGICVGQGALMALCCDFMLVSDSTKFGFPIARSVGNCLTIKNYKRLIDVFPVRIVKDMLMRAKFLSGQDLLECSIVNEVARDRAELLKQADDMIVEMAELAPLTLSATSEAIRRIQTSETLPSDTDLLLKTYLSEDGAEAVDAFKSKRKPVWRRR